MKTTIRDTHAQQTNPDELQMKVNQLYNGDCLRFDDIVIAVVDYEFILYLKLI